MVCDSHYEGCKRRIDAVGPQLLHCKYHIIPNGCYECEPGWVVSSDDLSCVAVPAAMDNDTGLRGCRKTVDSAVTQCQECLPNYSAFKDNSRCIKTEDIGACVLQCEPGYWVDWGGTTDPLRQRCISDNCRTADPDDPDRCTSCWGAREVKYYPNWLGSNSYSLDDIAGIDTKEPFLLEPADGWCKMGCGPGYFLDQLTTVAPRAQKCSHCSINCRTCAIKPGRCRSCWNISDLSGSYEMQQAYKNLVGVREPAIFYLEGSDKSCRLNCNVDLGFRLDFIDSFTQECFNCYTEGWPKKYYD
jgi:hypothetical protein